MSNITIIDTGCANLSSVKFAFQRLGYSAEITNDLNKIKSADKLILPGVGTAKAAMLNLQRLGLVEVIQNLTQPVLGICLGMQLMTAFSTEGNVSILGLMNGQTELIPDTGLPLPHIGWNRVHFDENCPLFDGIAQDSHFYLCIAMRYCLMKIPLRPANMVWIFLPLSLAITSTAYNSTLNVQAKMVRCC